MTRKPVLLSSKQVRTILSALMVASRFKTTSGKVYIRKLMKILREQGL